MTQKAVEDCARAGARSVDELTVKLGVAAGCGRCRDCVMELLREACSEGGAKSGELAPA